jgi:DNA-binding CsgD family transcriptional regulator
MEGVPVSVETSLESFCLSRREREVLQHLAAGYTYVSVARRMNISRHTVDAYVRRIKRKVGSASWPYVLGLACAAGAPDAAGAAHAN